MFRPTSIHVRITYIYLIGIKSLNKLLKLVQQKFTQSIPLVEDYIDKDLYIRYQMEDHTIGDAKWCMLEMKRYEILGLCKKELVESKHYGLANSVYCSNCHNILYYDQDCADNICKNCGLAFRAYTEIITFNAGENYSRIIHRYCMDEHFAQTLSDFANIGDRNVPTSIMTYCRAALGRGITVTSQRVYDALKQNGYRSHYQYKYEIANRLRGRREFTITSHEVEKFRTMYKRYASEIIPFQRLNDIGSISRRGKLRVFWPMRFILARLCEDIGRKDLVRFIRPIACKTRIKSYMDYWVKLVTIVDSRTRRPTFTSNIEYIKLTTL